MSERRVVDPLMDTVRVITARLAAGGALTDRDKTDLIDLQQKLKKYLVTEDPLRSFTPESLGQKLDEQSAVHPTLLTRHPILRLIGAWSFAFILFMISFVLVRQFRFPASQSAQVSAVAFFIGLHLAMAWFYVSALRNFNAAMKRAYGLVVAGVILTGIGLAQFPLLPLLDLEHYPLLRYGGFIMIVGISSMLLYAGARAFSVLLGVKTIFASARLAIGLGLGAAIILLPLCILQHPASLYGFYIGMLGNAYLLLYCLLGALVSHRSAERASRQLAPALRIYGWTLLMVCVGAIIDGTYTYLHPYMAGLVPLYGVLPYLVSELLMLQAGYTFKQRAGA